MLETEVSVLNQNEQQNMYALALNFCNKKVRNGENYYEQMLDIYLLMLEKDLLNDGKFLYHKYLKNIVSTALKAEKLELAKKITLTYKNTVEQKFRKTLFHLNMGAYFFYKREFAKAEKHFTRIEGITLDYEINRRTLLLKLYYESDNELFEYEVDNFLHFIKNNRAIAEKLKKGHLNFAKMTFKLYKEKIKLKQRRPNLEKLMGKIEKLSPVSDKKWLLDELRKLLYKVR